MKKTWVLLIVVVAVLAACGGQPPTPNAATTAVASESEHSDGLPQFDAPTTERIRVSDLGPHYVIGELMLGLNDEPADSLERASAIATEFGGRVSAGFPDLRIYQLSFGDEEIEELRMLADRIANLPDVEAVGVHYIGPFDQ